MSLVLDTVFRQTPSSTDPSVSRLIFQNRLYAGLFKIEKVILPVAWYNIDAYNQSFYIKVGVTTYTATITPSNYTIATLCTALENGLNAATSTLHYSVSYSTVTNKITITNTNGDSFTVENGTSGNTLHCGLQTDRKSVV